MKYMCELCGTVYCEEVGDPTHGIPAGTAFAALPAHYECPICGSEKEAFGPAGQPGRPVVSGELDRSSLWKEAKYTDEHQNSQR